VRSRLRDSYAAAAPHAAHRQSGTPSQEYSRTALTVVFLEGAQALPINFIKVEKKKKPQALLI